MLTWKNLVTIFTSLVWLNLSACDGKPEHPEDDETSGDENPGDGRDPRDVVPPLPIAPP